MAHGPATRPQTPKRHLTDRTDSRQPCESDAGLGRVDTLTTVSHLQEGRLRSLFQGKGPAAINSPQTPDAPRTEPSSPEQAALSAEQTKDLSAAWVELNEAAEQSEVLNFRACATAGSVLDPKTGQLSGP